MGRLKAFFWGTMDVIESLGAADPTGLIAEVDCIINGAEVHEIQAGGSTHRNLKEKYPGARLIQLSPDGKHIWFNTPKK